jgi:hypothetical protein
LTLQLPSDVEKEAEAKKGLTKLLLFHICGKLNDDSTSFGNLSYPEPSQGTKIVLDSACPARARLPIPAGILRIPVFSAPVAFFSQESRFLFRRNFFGMSSGNLSVWGLHRKLRRK